MFILRCAFWLSMVYASMSWSPASFAPAAAAPDMIAAGRYQADSLMKAAAARASGFCAQNPEGCLADAARLTSLFTVAERVDEDDAAYGESIGPVPLPVPDPRRMSSRGAKLAHLP